MTHSLEANMGGGRDAEAPRLQLTARAPASTHLDGAWWPRSPELSTELPILVDALSDRIGAVTVVGYHLNAWTQAPSQMQIADDTVQSEGFTSDEPATIILIGHDGRRVTLRVIAPTATDPVGRRELDAASRELDDFDSGTNRAEQVVARSVTEVAVQLARHEGRANPDRTAEIARWCEEAAHQFSNSPVQTFVPILVHHIVRNRMITPRPYSEAQRL